MDDVVDQFSRVVELLLAQDLDGSRLAALEISREDLLADKRSREAFVRDTAKGNWGESPGRRAGRNPGPGQVLRVFKRDGYVCRFSACGRRTIDIDVLRAVSGLLPDEVPYHLHWAMSATHPIYWTHGASFEHVAWSSGGTHDDDNVVTACGTCNYAKSSVSLEQLGWRLSPVPTDTNWDGLRPKLEALRALLPGASTSPKASAAPRKPGVVRLNVAAPAADRRVVPVAHLQVGNVVLVAIEGNIQRRKHRVAGITRDSLLLEEIWREHGRWVLGRPRTFSLSGVESVIRTDLIAPSHGAPASG